MKLVRVTSILAALLLTAGSLSITACNKSEDDKKGDDKATKKTEPEAAAAKATDPTTAKKLIDKEMPKTPDGTGGAVEIKMDRPLAVGFEYMLTTRFKRDMKVTVNGAPGPGSGVMSWTYEAEVTVKAVSTRGGPTTEEHKVVKFEVIMDGATKAPIEKGKVITASVKGDEETFTMDGAPVDKQLAKLLGDAIDLDEGGPSEQEIFGSKEKKKPGDSWDVNAAVLAKSFSKKATKLPPRPENISGKITYKGSKQQSGMKVLMLTSTIKVKDFAPDMGPIQPTGGTMELTVDGWMPADPASIAASGEVKKLVGRFEGTAGGKKIVLDMTVRGEEMRVAIK